MVEDGEMTIDDLINKERARSRAGAELRELKKASVSANNALDETVVTVIEAFQTRNDELALQRARIIQQLSREYPRIADELDQKFQIPSHSRGKHTIQMRGFLFSFERLRETQDESVCVSAQPSIPLSDQDNVSRFVASLSTHHWHHLT